MKSLLLTGTALAVTSGLLSAQTLTVTAPGYATTKLFDSTPGFTITGLAASPSGDIFYIETDSLFTAPSKLFRRSTSDGYASATPLFDFASPLFGSFVVWEAGKVIFGESSTGAIRAANADLSIDALGVVAANYDAAFSGGSLFLSHNPGGFAAQNKVSRFDLLPDGSGGLTLSAADLILDTPDDYSGPLEFDSAANLFYGGSGAFARPDLFRFSAAEVAGAFGAGPVQTLDSAHRYLANGANAYLAFDGDDALWHTNFNSLNLIGTGAPAVSVIATSTDNIGHLDRVGPTLYANVTKSSFDRSAVYSVVPEPSAAALVAFGFAILARRRHDLRGGKRS